MYTCKLVEVIRHTLGVKQWLDLEEMRWILYYYTFRFARRLYFLSVAKITHARLGQSQSRIFYEHWQNMISEMFFMCILHARQFTKKWRWRMMTRFLTTITRVCCVMCRICISCRRFSTCSAMTNFPLLCHIIWWERWSLQKKYGMSKGKHWTLSTKIWGIKFTLHFSQWFSLSHLVFLPFLL